MLFSGGGLLELARLALPISAARIGLTMMLVVDSMMVGHFGTGDLAGLAFASVFVQTAQTVGLGLLTGGLVEISAAIGRGDLPDAGAIWRRSLGYALAIGLIAVGLGAFAGDLFLATGLAPELAAEAAGIVGILGWSLPPMLVYIASVMLLESMGRPFVAVWIMLGANVANLLLDWLLVFGPFGLPALGAEGAALGTLAVRVCIAVAIVAYIVRILPERRALGRPRLADHRWSAGRRQRRLGVAEGLSMGIESGSFSMMAVFAGRFGALELAAYTIAININMLLFMIAVGVGGATAVLAARARGRGDPAGMAAAAWSGYGVFAGATGVIAVLLAVFPAAALGFYTNDPALAAVALPLVAIVGFVNLVDGAQRVVANVLRAYGEAWLPTSSHLFSYVFVMVPVGWLLGVAAGLGAMGLVLAIAIASVVATVLLFARFLWLSSRPLALAGGLRAGETG